MSRYFAAVVFVLGTLSAAAQQDSTVSKKIAMQGTLPRSNDHFLIQVGYAGWAGAPDSIQTGGFSRSFNMYLMLDFPFKTNPHLSAAIGAGMGTDNIFFKNTAVAITSTNTTLAFPNLSAANHFKRYKLATAYAEAPVELRYTSKPDESRRSVKVALGVKVGTLLNAHTKGSTLENSAGNTVNDYKEKLYSKRYFNKTRISGTARLGFGHFTLFGNYQLTPLFREGVAPAIRPYTVGLTLSGL